jgi:spermidine synthase
MKTALLIRQLWTILALSAFGQECLRAQDFQIIHEVQSQYQRISVLDTANGYRQLIFDGKFDGTDAIQSEMNLSRPNDLTLSYSRHMMAALSLVEEPKRILVVGLGGACMQRYLHQLLPSVTIETVELDPAIRRIATEYFSFHEDGRQIVHISDGRRYLEDSKDQYDIVFLDAFTATSIPYRLATREFFNAVKSRIAKGGIVCANLWDENADFPHMLKTFSSVFPELHSLKGANSGNFILLAFSKTIGLTVQEWAKKAEVFEQKHPTGLDLPLLIRQGARQRTSIPANARVLLDKDAH